MNSEYTQNPEELAYRYQKFYSVDEVSLIVGMLAGKWQ